MSGELVGKANAVNLVNKQRCDYPTIVLPVADGLFHPDPLHSTNRPFPRELVCVNGLDAGPVKCQWSPGYGYINNRRFNYGPGNRVAPFRQYGQSDPPVEADASGRRYASGFCQHIKVKFKADLPAATDPLTFTAPIDGPSNYLVYSNHYLEEGITFALADGTDEGHAWVPHADLLNILNGIGFRVTFGGTYPDTGQINADHSFTWNAATQGGTHHFFGEVDQPFLGWNGSSVLKTHQTVFRVRNAFRLPAPLDQFFIELLIDMPASPETGNDVHPYRHIKFHIRIINSKISVGEFSNPNRKFFNLNQNVVFYVTGADARILGDSINCNSWPTQGATDNHQWVFWDVTRNGSNAWCTDCGFRRRGVLLSNLARTAGMMADTHDAEKLHDTMGPIMAITTNYRDGDPAASRLGQRYKRHWSMWGHLSRWEANDKPYPPVYANDTEAYKSGAYITSLAWTTQAGRRLPAQEQPSMGCTVRAPGQSSTGAGTQLLTSWAHFMPGAGVPDFREAVATISRECYRGQSDRREHDMSLMRTWNYTFRNPNFGHQQGSTWDLDLCRLASWGTAMRDDLTGSPFLLPGSRDDTGGDVSLGGWKSYDAQHFHPRFLLCMIQLWGDEDAIDILHSYQAVGHGWAGFPLDQNGNWDPNYVGNWSGAGGSRTIRTIADYKRQWENCEAKDAKEMAREILDASGGAIGYMLTGDPLWKKWFGYVWNLFSGKHRVTRPAEGLRPGGFPTFYNPADGLLEYTARSGRDTGEYYPDFVNGEGFEDGEGFLTDKQAYISLAGGGWGNSTPHYQCGNGGGPSRWGETTPLQFSGLVGRGSFNASFVGILDAMKSLGVNQLCDSGILTPRVGDLNHQLGALMFLTLHKAFYDPDISWTDEINAKALEVAYDLIKHSYSLAMFAAYGTPLDIPLPPTGAPAFEQTCRQTYGNIPYHPYVPHNLTRAEQVAHPNYRKGLTQEDLYPVLSSGYISSRWRGWAPIGYGWPRAPNDRGGSYYYLMPLAWGYDLAFGEDGFLLNDVTANAFRYQGGEILYERFRRIRNNANDPIYENGSALGDPSNYAGWQSPTVFWQDRPGQGGTGNPQTIFAFGSHTAYYLRNRRFDPGGGGGPRNLGTPTAPIILGSGGGPDFTATPVNIRTLRGNIDDFIYLDSADGAIDFQVHVMNANMPIGIPLTTPRPIPQFILGSGDPDAPDFAVTIAGYRPFISPTTHLISAILDGDDTTGGMTASLTKDLVKNIEAVLDGAGGPDFRAMIQRVRPPVSKPHTIEVKGFVVDPIRITSMVSSQIPNTVHGRAYAGDDTDIVVNTYSGNTGVPYSLSGAAAIKWKLFEEEKDEKTVVGELTLGSGIEIEDEEGGVFRVSIPAGFTQGLQGKLYHECQLTTSDGKSLTLFLGYLTLTPTLVM